MTVITISPAAAVALRAAYLRKTIGRAAAAAMARKAGVSSLYRLALQLAAANHAGF